MSTTTTLDRNDQFKAEKLGQIEQPRAIVEANRADIASYDSGATQAAIDARMADQAAKGKIKLIGNDRYLVLEGWDANEVFAIQRARRPGEIPLILPETGLDMKNGKAQLYLREPAWHDLGTVIDGGTTSISDVLDASGGGYLVNQAPAQYFVPEADASGMGGLDGDITIPYADASGMGGLDGDITIPYAGLLRKVPGQFVNWRDDTGEALGVVGRIYTPVQNRDAMAFLQELNGSGDVIWESAGPLRGGRRFFVVVRLPDDLVIDEGGTEEIIRKYVAVINSHDGTTPLSAISTPWNIVCGNTERFAMRDATAKWTVRHTTYALDKVAEARRTLGLAEKYYDQFKAEEDKLAHTEMLLDEFDKLVTGLWPADKDATDKAKGIAERRHEALRAGFKGASQRLGSTARAAEYTVTEFLDWAAPRRALRDDAGRADPMAAAKATIALEGGDDDLKSKAHRQLMKLTVK